MDRRTRLELSDLAARLMLECGLDWASARTKAARRLGIPPGRARQVEELEIQQALQAHRALFAPQSPDQLRELRMAALHAMELLSEFDPRLIGAVATGVVTPYTPVELVVHPSSEKDIEHRLINAGVRFEVTSIPGAQGVGYRCADAEPVVLILANIRKGSGNRPSPRSAQGVSLKLSELEALLSRDSVEDERGAVAK